MVKYTGRGLVVKRPGVLSKVQMLNLVLGSGCRKGGVWSRGVCRHTKTAKTVKTAKTIKTVNGLDGNVALKLAEISLKLLQISLSKGYFGQFKGYILCSGNVGVFFASEGGSCHRGFTIVLIQTGILQTLRCTFRVWGFQGSVARRSGRQV